jgi:hypothetical protein
VWTTGVAGLFLLAAGLSGGAFLTYNKDVYSLPMGLFFGAAILSYAIDIYLFMRSPEVGRTLRSARASRR